MFVLWLLLLEVWVYGAMQAINHYKLTHYKSNPNSIVRYDPFVYCVCSILQKQNILSILQGLL